MLAEVSVCPTRAGEERMMMMVMMDVGSGWVGWVHVGVVGGAWWWASWVGPPPLKALHPPSHQAK